MQISERATNPAAEIPPFAEETEDYIRRCAYFLWVDAGRPEGKDLEHWFVAQERFLAAAGPAGTATPRTVEGEAEHFSIRNTTAAHLSDPAHRFHAPKAGHDQRTDVLAGEAQQRARGRRQGGSLRQQPRSGE